MGQKSQITMRHYVNGDAPRLADICRRSALAAGSDVHSTLEPLPSEDEIDAILSHGELGAVAEIGGDVAGYVAIRSWVEKGGLHVYVHEEQVDPNVRGPEISTALLLWAEHRIRQLAGDDGAELAVCGTNASSTQHDRIRLLTDNEYSEAFTMVEMEVTNLNGLPKVTPIDERYEVRSGTHVDARKLWELNEAVYADRALTSTNDESDYAEFFASIGDNNLITIAEADGEPVAFVLSELHGSDAEILEVSVHPRHRREGLAAELLRRNLALLADRKITRVRLHTSGEDVSGARSLYAQFGFAEVETHMRYRKDITPEVGLVRSGSRCSANNRLDS